jgi:thiamine-phosphate pyrophosphorylase
VYPSATKPNAVLAPLELFRATREKITLPIVAIGGLTAENGAAVLKAGADALAVIDGVFGQPDIFSAADRLAALFG